MAGTVTLARPAVAAEPTRVHDTSTSVQVVATNGDRQVEVSVERSETIGERAPMLPQRLAGRDLFWWLTRLGLLRVTVNSRLGRPR